MTDQPLHPIQPIRIVFCTNGGLNGALVLERLRRSPRCKIVGVVLSTRLLRARQNYLQGAMEFARRCGVAYALYLWCATSLADWLLRFSPIAPVARLAKRLAVPMMTTRQINGAECIQFVNEASADLLVSAFFNQRIDAAVTALPRFGAINIHPSPLPDFRGVDPVFHATLQCAPVFGASVHRIAMEFDTGPILARETRPADTERGVFWNTAHSYLRGAELLIGAIDEITHGAPGVAQTQGGSYASWPTASQVSTLRTRGVKLVTLKDLLNIVGGKFPGLESGVGK